MYHAILGEDRPGTLEAVRRPPRPSRPPLRRQGEGRLLLVGPSPPSIPRSRSPGFSSLIVAEFPSLADAETWAGADPYVAGVLRPGDGQTLPGRFFRRDGRHRIPAPAIA